MRRSTNLLITGKPGVGKTTLINEVLRSFKGDFGGFYTKELRRQNQRYAFEIITFDGKRALLASCDIKSKFRVGRYGVNIENFEKTALSSLDDALKNKDLVVIDEIGKMELFSERFKRIVLSCLNSEKMVLATITLAKIDFVEEIKAREDVQIFTLTISNFSEIKKKVLELL
jgi:nucleoside-triphosphatase